ncbi:MAG: methyltransferase domain-containing protein, partial [Desulfobacterales bacterium]|nr:methyltransferase domain-containing protein [Desulfobacterales bacterium]
MERDQREKRDEWVDWARLLREVDDLRIGPRPEDDPSAFLEEARERMIDLLTRGLPKSPGRVLALDRAPGLLARRLAQKGWEVDALSPSPAMIARAREREPGPRVHFRVRDYADTDGLKSMGKPYDAILFFESLAHFPSPAAAFGMAAA